jgi:DNA-binding NarL/FixJ family response regulator
LNEKIRQIPTPSAKVAKNGYAMSLNFDSRCFNQKISMNLRRSCRRLTWHDRTIIMNMSKAGKSQKDIALALDVSIATVSRQSINLRLNCHRRRAYGANQALFS